MERFTFPELADMHMAYGAAEGNGRAALRIYAARYPLRRHPHHTTFANISIGGLERERGTVTSLRIETGRPRHARTANNMENVLGAVAKNPRTSSRALAADLRLTPSTVWRMLHEQLLYPYHFQRVQAMNADDYPRRRVFCQWFMHKVAQDRQFPNYVLFTEECTFTRGGMFNTHNLHYWEEENPHVTWNRGYQERFSLNIWCGIVGDYLLRPHVI